MSDTQLTRGPWWSALDARRIGNVYLSGTLVNFALGFTMALLLSLENLGPGRDALAPEVFAQLMTMHGVIMLFLCVLPALSGVMGNLVLPRLLGSDDLAFPQLNRVGMQLYVLGGAIAIVSILSGGLDTGWTLLAPLAAQSGVPAALLGAGLHLVGLSLVVQAFVIVGTILRQRPEGGLIELPILAWSFFAWGVMQVLAAPILSAVALMLLGDQLDGATLFDPAYGGDPVAFANFFWFATSAAIQLTLLPCIGIFSEVLRRASRKPLHGKSALVWAMLALALLAPTAWGVHLVAGENAPDVSTAFSALSLLSLVPLSVIVYCWMGTLRDGAIRLNTPLFFALAGVIHLVIGALGWLFLSALSTNLFLEGTRFSSAQLHYLMAGAWGCALLAGLHQWWFAITGRHYDERSAAWGVGVSVVGFNLAFLPGFVLGANGLLASSYHYPESLISLQRVTVVGTGILAVGLLMVAGNLLRSLMGEALSSSQGVSEAS